MATTCHLGPTVLIRGRHGVWTLRRPDLNPVVINLQRTSSNAKRSVHFNGENAVTKHNATKGVSFRFLRST